MRIETTPEVRSFVRERGGLLFVRVKRYMALRGMATLEVTTEPPPDALEWRRIETRGFVLFVPRAMRLPRTLELELRGRITRRIHAYWNGCAYVI
jgi:hypothetical protein